MVDPANRRIVIVYPSRSVGGAQMLFLRILLAVHAEQTAKIAVIDYQDGWISGQLRDRGLQFDLLDVEKGPFFLKKEDVVLAATSFARILFQFIDRQSPASIAFWTIHPMNLIPLPNWVKSNPLRVPWLLKQAIQVLFSWHRQQFRTFVSIAHSKHAIAFMDAANKDAFEAMLANNLEDPVLLPIPMEMPNSGQRISTRDAGVQPIQPQKFGWLGRVDESFKLFALQRSIEDVSDWAKNNGLPSPQFMVIGDGPGIEKLATWIESSALHVDVDLAGTKIGKELDDCLGNLDVLIAMGTAGLEGGARSVATLMTDFSYVPITKPGRYSWIFDQQNFDLGRNLNAIGYVSNGAPLTQQLKRFEDLDVARACRTYVEECHSIENLRSEIFDFLRRTNLRISELRNSVSSLWFK